MVRLLVSLCEICLMKADVVTKKQKCKVKAEKLTLAFISAEL